MFHLRVGATPEVELDAIIAASGRRGDISPWLRDLRDHYAVEIRRRFPDITRRVAGYNLDELLPEHGFNVARALVGTGSCCSAMDMAKYQAQVGALRSYARTPEIPAEPVRHPRRVAKTLLGYDRSIVLTAHDQATFDAAMQMTSDTGPCCCHCWRRNATEGLDKDLIAKRFIARPGGAGVGAAPG